MAHLKLQVRVPQETADRLKEIGKNATMSEIIRAALNNYIQGYGKINIDIEDTEETEKGLEKLISKAIRMADEAETKEEEKALDQIIMGIKIGTLKQEKRRLKNK